MKINQAHLTYCTNIHAGESWEEHSLALKNNFPGIKNKISPDQPMGIGLRLSNVASIELEKIENLVLFQDWLERESAYVFTMNGFPYGGFHHTRVKDQVHAPDWTTQERVDYTLRLFHILKVLLPEGVEGGISTSPLTYRHWFSHSSEALSKAKEAATFNVLTVVEELFHIRQMSLKVLHLDIEPEPDGLLETGEEFIDWFEQHLLPAGVSLLTEKYGLSIAEAEEALKLHVRLCYDVCHFAIGYESHSEIVDRLEESGIQIGKIQISAALKAPLSPDVAGRHSVAKAFSRFNENTYLHQVVAKTKNGSLLRYPDLPEALEDILNPEAEEWRAHFHVPVFVEHFGKLQSTQSDIVEVLILQNTRFLSGHLEVETYTWEVLPQALKLPLQNSIIRELEWVKNQLT